MLSRGNRPPPCEARGTFGGSLGATFPRAECLSAPPPDAGAPSRPEEQRRRELPSAADGVLRPVSATLEGDNTRVCESMSCVVVQLCSRLWHQTLQGPDSVCVLFEDSETGAVSPRPAVACEFLHLPPTCLAELPIASILVWSSLTRYKQTSPSLF